MPPKKAARMFGVGVAAQPFQHAGLAGVPFQPNVVSSLGKRIAQSGGGVFDQNGTSVDALGGGNSSRCAEKSRFYVRLELLGGQRAGVFVSVRPPLFSADTQEGQKLHARLPDSKLS